MFQGNYRKIDITLYIIWLHPSQTLPCADLGPPQPPKLFTDPPVVSFYPRRALRMFDAQSGTDESFPFRFSGRSVQTEFELFTARAHVSRCVIAAIRRMQMCQLGSRQSRDAGRRPPHTAHCMLPNAGCSWNPLLISTQRLQSFGFKC